MKLLLFLMFSVFTVFCFAQRTETIYLTKDWKRTNNKKEAEYYRIVNYNAEGKPVGFVKDYFMNGKVHVEALKSYVDSSNVNLDTTIGERRAYAQNGQLIDSVFFEHGKIKGVRKQWYDSGKVYAISYYDEGELHGDQIAYWSNGNFLYQMNFNHGVLTGMNGQYYLYDTYKTNYFYDDFHLDDNPYHWKLPDSSAANSIIQKDSGLFINNHSEHNAIAVLEIPKKYITRFSYVCFLKQKKGEANDGYGMVYDYINNNNYRYFLVRSDGNFLTGRIAEGKEMEKNTWKKTKKLIGKVEFEMLAVARNGDKMEFYINKKKITSEKYIPISASCAGVICTKPGQLVLLRSIHSFQW